MVAREGDGGVNLAQCIDPATGRYRTDLQPQGAWRESTGRRRGVRVRRSNGRPVLSRVLAVLRAAGEPLGRAEIIARMGGQKPDGVMPLACEEGWITRVAARGKIGRYRYTLGPLALGGAQPWLPSPPAAPAASGPGVPRQGARR